LMTLETVEIIAASSATGERQTQDASSGRDGG
jgi:hypothetical protein